MDSGDRFSPLLRELHALCKPSRVAHSLSVAGTTAFLCGRFGVDPGKGMTAGIIHDLLKDRPYPEQLTWSAKSHMMPEMEQVSRIVRQMETEALFIEKVIHGPASAVYARVVLGISDLEVIEAVAYHSTGQVGMPILARLLFAADKIEPGRECFKDSDEEDLKRLDPDELLLKALEYSMGYLRARGGAIAQSTVDLYNALRSRDVVR